MAEIINCLRCGYGEAKKAAKFYAATFPGSHVDRVNNAASDYHGGKEGDDLTVEFTVLGRALGVSREREILQ
jgi:predicted 3-demethylubiquinone-9 3-methyltransferase (glyoxalase superfamily)